MGNQRDGLFRRRIPAGLAIVVTIIGIGVVAWWLIVPAADWLAYHDVGRAGGTTLIDARNNARGALLTLGAGVLAAGALVFTARNFVLSQRTLQLTERGQRRSFELTEQAQVTDRYTKAVEQLGSDKLDIRIGGIYALERIAHDSERDHPTIMEVLSTFIREHSLDQLLTGHDSGQRGQAEGADSRPSLRADVQAAVTVLGRRNKQYDTRPIKLNHVDLSGADLTGADFAGADLFQAVLTRAVLADADLTGVHLVGANLTGALLVRTNLSGAHLVGTILSRADLSGACLTEANLASANLARANLTSVDLSGASLTGALLIDAYLGLAVLKGVDVISADLSGARWPSPDAPEGWRLGIDGCLRRGSATHG